MSVAGEARVPERDPLSGFTFRARKVLQLANQEAHRLNHIHLGPEHLLLGLVKDDAGLASWLLRGSGCFLLDARAAVSRASPAARGLTSGRLAWTDEVHSAVARAATVAGHLDHPLVGTGHLLLALLSECEPAIARVFTDATPDPGLLRDRVLAALAGTNWLAVEQHAGYDGYGPAPPLGMRVSGP